MPMHDYAAPLERLLTPGEVAELIGVAGATLEKWRVTGRYNLPYVRVGRRVMYRPADVHAFVEQRVRLHTGQHVT